TLLAGFADAGDQLLARELFAPAVFLDEVERDSLYALVCREAAGAFGIQALAAAAHGVIDVARIDDLGVFRAAVGASHVLSVALARSRPLRPLPLHLRHECEINTTSSACQRPLRICNATY